MWYAKCKLAIIQEIIEEGGRGKKAGDTWKLSESALSL